MNSPSTGKRRAHRRTQTATLSPPRNKVWTRFGPSYWTAGDYFIRQDQTGFRLGEYSGRTQHQIGTYPTLEQAQGAIQKENPISTTLDWVNRGQGYWSADTPLAQYFIRPDGDKRLNYGSIEYELFYRSKHTGRPKFIGYYREVKVAKEVAQRHADRSKLNPRDESVIWATADLALVLGLGAGAIYLVYKAASALGTALGKSIGGATPAPGA